MVSSVNGVLTSARLPSHVAIVIVCLLLLLPAVPGRPASGLSRRSNYMGLKALCKANPRNCNSPTIFTKRSDALSRRLILEALEARLQNFVPQTIDPNADRIFAEEPRGVTLNELFRIQASHMK